MVAKDCCRAGDVVPHVEHESLQNMQAAVATADLPNPEVIPKHRKVHKVVNGTTGNKWSK